MHAWMLDIHVWYFYILADTDGFTYVQIYMPIHVHYKFQRKAVFTQGCEQSLVDNKLKSQGLKTSSAGFALVEGHDICV